MALHDSNAKLGTEWYCMTAVESSILNSTSGQQSKARYGMIQHGMLLPSKAKLYYPSARYTTEYSKTSRGSTDSTTTSHGMTQHSTIGKRELHL